MTLIITQQMYGVFDVGDRVIFSLSFIPEQKATVTCWRTDECGTLYFIKLDGSDVEVPVLDQWIYPLY